MFLLRILGLKKFKEIINKYFPELLFATANKSSFLYLLQAGLKVSVISKTLALSE
jgi:hypothetical protein